MNNAASNKAKQIKREKGCAELKDGAQACVVAPTSIMQPLACVHVGSCVRVRSEDITPKSGEKK